jgi:hypothetical protein
MAAKASRLTVTNRAQVPQIEQSNQIAFHRRKRQGRSSKLRQPGHKAAGPYGSLVCRRFHVFPNVDRARRQGQDPRIETSSHAERVVLESSSRPERLTNRKVELHDRLRRRSEMRGSLGLGLVELPCSTPTRIASEANSRDGLAGDSGWCGYFGLEPGGHSGRNRPENMRSTLSF